MNEEDPDLLAGKNLDELRGRKMYIPMSECWEETENAKYQNNLLAQKCRELEREGFALAANQCHAGYAGEYGHHRCKEIDRLTEERDEARREVCDMHHLTGFLRGDYANSRKWDCFPNKHHKFSQSAKDFNEYLKGQEKVWLDNNESRRAEIEQLRAERDDARSLYCFILEMYKCGSGKEEAKKRGWFCFTENTND